MRISQTVIWILSALAQLAILVAGFMTNFRSLLGSEPDAFYKLLLINIALIFLVLYLKIEGTGNVLETRVNAVSTTLNRLDSDRSSVCSLVDHDFYARFKRVIGEATVGVHITHLDTLPPNRPRKTEANDYYATLARTVRSRPRVSFRRVERFSVEKKEWIDGLVEEYTGVDNFSLAVLLHNSRDRYTGLVSVQIVDDHQAVLVAVAEHYSSVGARDVWITDKSCTGLWTSYYDNILWRPAAKVLENGRLNKAEYDRVKAFVVN